MQQKPFLERLRKSPRFLPPLSVDPLYPVQNWLESVEGGLDYSSQIILKIGKVPKGPGPSIS